MQICSKDFLIIFSKFMFDNFTNTFVNTHILPYCMCSENTCKKYIFDPKNCFKSTYSKGGKLKFWGNNTQQHSASSFTISAIGCELTGSGRRGRLLVSSDAGVGEWCQLIVFKAHCVIQYLLYLKEILCLSTEMMKTYLCVLVFLKHTI